MTRAQWNTLLSLNAVDTFLDIHAARLARVVATGARAKLKSTLAELATLRSEQEGNKLVAKSSTVDKGSLRTALMRDHMAPIARIAEAELAQTPEFSSLRMPRGRPTISRLVSAAEGMAKAAAPYSSIFTGNGLSADFVVQLNGILPQFR